MTNENISGFLNSIAEAKRAFDAEPEYQSRIAELERDKQRLGETVASRELRIHQLKQDQETLTQRLRSAEVERDDAGFRALEEADRVSALLTLVRGFVGDGLKAISAVEGVEQIVVSKPALDGQLNELNEMREQLLSTQAELAALRDDMRLAQEQLTRPFPTEGAIALTPVHDTSSSSGDTMDPSFKSDRERWTNEDGSYAELQPVKGPSAVDPTTASTPSSAVGQTVDLNASSVGSGLTETTSMTGALTGTGWHEGQSDGPFASADITPTTQSETASSQSATAGEGVVSNASPPERNRDESTRFKGRKYYDVTYFVPLHEWLSKGGTREDYDWRPLPEANRVYSS